jgi:hypothetical protein
LGAAAATTVSAFHRRRRLERNPSLADVAQTRFRIALEAARKEFAAAARHRARKRFEIDRAREHPGQRVRDRLSLEEASGRRSYSNSTTPNAQMSARLSTGFRAHCSGLM